MAYGPPGIDAIGGPRPNGHVLDALNPLAVAYARQQLQRRGIRVPQGQDPAALWRALNASIYQGRPPLGQRNVNLSGGAYGNGNPNPAYLNGGSYGNGAQNPVAASPYRLPNARTPRAGLAALIGPPLSRPQTTSPLAAMIAGQFGIR